MYIYIYTNSGVILGGMYGAYGGLCSAQLSGLFVDSLRSYAYGTGMALRGTGLV